MSDAGQSKARRFASNLCRGPESRANRRRKQGTITRSFLDANNIDQIDQAATRTAFVVVDLEGTRSLMVGYAISRADLVIVPTQGSLLDATEAANAIRLVRSTPDA